MNQRNKFDAVDNTSLRSESVLATKDLE